MRRYIEKLRPRLACLSRVAAGLLCLALLGAVLSLAVYGQGIVTVTDQHGGSQTLLTRDTRPTRVVQRMGLVAGYHDEVVYTESGQNDGEVLIRRAFPVEAEADGETFSAEFVEGTVADLLAECEIELAGEDFVEPALATPLEEGLTAEVHRVTYREEQTRTEVPEELVDEYMEQLFAAEPESEFRKSNAGIYDVTYKHTLIDGEISDSHVERLIPIITPRDPGSTAFEPGVPCSTIEGFEDVEIGEDGLPTNYTRLWPGAVCTAYSSSGGRGSSGLGLYCGTVAVNPNVIPYGTRMYITASDGSFVYGYAIATDTGTAMMAGHVDLDLYFATYGESVRFGKRALDVYILD